LENVASQADVRLRTEVGELTTLIDNAVGVLKRQVDTLEAKTRATEAVPSAAAAAGMAPPPAALGLGPQADQLSELERRTTLLAAGLEQVRERAAAIGTLVEKQDMCLKDHDNSMRILDTRITSIAEMRSQTAQPAAQPPAFGGDFGANFTQGAQGAAQQPFGSQPTGVPVVEHDIGSLHGDRPRGGPWKLYVVKYLLDG
jgi:multidrug efflux pump subunit AcrA (membrane-fusion protein)